MNKLLAAIGLTFALLTPAAASAAEIDCILERTPAPLKAEVTAIAARVAADSEGTPGGEATITTKLTAPRDACAKAYRWNDAKAKAGMDYALATLLRTEMGRVLAAKGVSLAAIDRVVAQNIDVFDPKPGAPEMSPAQATKLIADARAAGLPVDGPLRNDILSYFGAVAVCNQIRREFQGA